MSLYWQERGHLLSKHSLLPSYGNDVIYYIFHPYILQTMIWRLLPQHSSVSEDTSLSFYLEARPMVSKLVPLFVICYCSHCALLCRIHCACAFILLLFPTFFFAEIMAISLKTVFYIITKVNQYSRQNWNPSTPNTRECYCRWWGGSCRQWVSVGAYFTCRWTCLCNQKLLLRFR